MKMSNRFNESRPRARELGLASGVYPPGPLNALTDVGDVRVGHVTLIEGDAIRTGATAILPHGGNVFQDKVPAGVVVGNGYGKLMGSTQIAELGEIETPILLTNTLAVPQAAEALLDWTLAQPGNEDVGSVNCVVGETNDGWLNDIRRRVLRAALIRPALETASGGPVAEGCVGAGTGTMALGWKGGIGTSSRMVTMLGQAYTVGALVQSNFGGVLLIKGVPFTPPAPPEPPGGSIMIVVATDAPLTDRNLTRLAARALAGLARTGAAMSNGSGDYVLAFSTAESARRTPERRAQVYAYPELPNAQVSPLFQAVIEATEEAILNSLLRATPMTGYRGHRAAALDVEQVRASPSF